jgi:pimeloyl-ACP methyl ester carboxylesterase
MLLLLFFAVGCSSVPPEQRKRLAQNLATQAGWSEKVLQTESFLLMSYGPQTAEAVDTITVYLEGDGYAWIGGRYPSDDPTPMSPIALQLALAQPSGTAVYLARPCQFLKTENGSRCSNLLWTRDRFSVQVLVSMNQALEQIKIIYGAKSVILVGYSGGARIALELAATRNDIDGLATVAGNMDPAGWVQALGLLPLSVSQDDRDLIHATERLPQTYFVGDQDVVVPADLTLQFVSRFPPDHKPQVRSIRGNGHVCCWVEQWPLLWRNLSEN